MTPDPKRQLDSANVIYAPARKPVAKTAIPHTPHFIMRDLGGAVKKEAAGISTYRGLSFDMLRYLSYVSPPITCMHSALVHQIEYGSEPYNSIEEKKHAISWEIVHKLHSDKNFKAPPESPQICQRIQEMFECPHPYYCDNFASFCTMLLTDYLVINRPTVEFLLDPYEENPRLYFHPVDGGILYPTLTHLQQYRQSRPELFPKPSDDPLDQTLQVFYDNESIDLTGAEYVIMQDGIVIGAVPYGRVLIKQFQTITDTRLSGFQPSLEELAIMSVVAYNNAFVYNTRQFTHGNMVDVLLGISDAYDDESIEEFKQDLLNNYTGLTGVGRIPIVKIRGKEDLMAIHLKNTNREMQFAEFMDIIVSLFTATYRTHKSIMNYMDKGQGKGVVFEANKEAEVGQAMTEGTHSRFKHIASICNAIVKRIHPDYRFRWRGLTRKDEEKEAKITQLELQTRRTTDEVRVEHGDEPFDTWWSKIPQNQLIFNAVSAERNQKQQAQMQTLDQQNQDQQFGQEDYGKELPENIRQYLQGGKLPDENENGEKIEDKRQGNPPGPTEGTSSTPRQSGTANQPEQQIPVNENPKKQFQKAITEDFIIIDVK